MQKAIVNLMILFCIGLTTDSVLAGIDCPNVTILVSNDPDLCSATVTIPMPTTEDCVITSITHNSPFGTAADPSGVYPLGSTQFEYTVNYTDDQGSQSTTCSINVIAEDNQTPMEPTCPPGMTITDCQSAGTAAQTVEEFIAQGGVLNFENCGYDHSLFESVEETLPITSSSCDFRIRRQYTVYDNYPGINNKVTCTQSILVSDEINPLIACPTAISNIACDDDLPSGAEDPVTFLSLLGSISDNCVAVQDLQISYTDNPETAMGACDQEGDPLTTIRTYEVIDNCGNSATCTQTLTYSADDVAPEIVCPSNATNLNCSNVLPLAETQLAGADNCDSATSFAVVGVMDDEMPASLCEGVVLSRVYTVSDACGNEVSCTQTFTFAPDTQGPTITCPDEASVVACTLDIPDPQTTLAGTDNCDEALTYTVTATDSDMPSTVCTDASITRTYTAVDACQNAGTCTQIIRITPNDESPTFTTSAPSTVEIGCSDDLPEFDLLEAEDHCGNAAGVTFAIEAAPELECADRIYEYTWTATDLCGNITEVTTIVTRKADVDGPFDVVCIPDISIDCNTTYPSPITSINAWLEASGEVADDCSFGGLTMSASDDQDPTSYSYCPDDGSFPITRKYTFTDGCGSSSTCDQTITLLPNTEPFVISCSTESRMITGESEDCGATLRPSAPVASSTCSTLSSTDMIIDGEIIEGMYTFESGAPTEVTWRFTDACGTVQECREMITVEDNIAPSFACEGGKVISLSSTNVQLGIEHFFEENSITDNCTDTYEVTIRRMTDNCGIEENLVDGESIEYCCGDIGQEVMVLVTVTDSNGNANTCMVSSTVTDKSPPSIICPADLTISCDTEIDMDNLGLHLGDVATSPEKRHEIIIDNEVVGLDGLVTDLCSTAEIIERVDDTGLTCSTGVIIRSFTAIDSEDNGNSCSQVITVIDGDPFSADDIIIPESIEVDLGCVTSPPTPEDLESAPTFTSSSCAHVFYTYNDDVFKFPDSGCMHIIRSFSVIDWCQNNDQGFPPLEFGPFTQHITLTNSDAPTITTCEPIEFCADASTCVASVELPYQGTDPCTRPEDLVWSWSLDVDNNRQDFITSTGSGSYLNENGQSYNVDDTGTSVVATLGIGEHAIKWTVEDNCGNSDVCTQVITVRDCKSPTIACLQGIAVSLVDMSPNPPMVELWASDFNASSTDNCTPDDELQFIFESTQDGNRTFTCDDVGETDVTIIVTDNDGNQSRCNTYVRVQDIDASSSEVALEVCIGETTDYTLPDGTTVNIGVGSYEYNVLSNVGSCEDRITVTVTEVADPTVTIENPTDTNCNFDLTDYMATPAGGVWTDQSGEPVDDVEDVTVGTYMYTYTNSTGCASSQQITITCCDVNGGEISLSDGSTTIDVCYVFGTDTDLDVQVVNNNGPISTWLITDTNNNLLVAPSTASPTDLEGLSPGTCRIYHVSSEAAVGMEVGDNISDLDGCVSLSNFISVTKDGVEAGSIATPNGATEVSYCTSNSGNDMLVLQLDGNDGDNTAWIITDASGQITEMPAGLPFNFSGRPAGVCNVYSITYQNGLAGLILGNNITDLDGCFELTDPVVITKYTGEDCTLNCDEITGGCVDVSARVAYITEDCNNGLVSLTTDVCNDGGTVATDVSAITAYPNAFERIQNINVPSGISYEQETGFISWSVPSLENGTCITLRFDLSTSTSTGPYEVVTYVVSTEETDSDSTPGAVQDTDGNGSMIDNLSGEDDEAGVEITLDGCIENFVWFDANRNGVSDADESPMADVQVCLYEIVNSELVAVGCNTTDSSGKFSFCSLPSGEYRVLFPTNISTNDQEYILTTTDAMGTAQEVSNDSDAYTESGFTLSYQLGYGRCENRVGAGYVDVETCTISGGTVAFAEGTYEVTYCTDDGEPDTPQFTPVNATGAHNAWVITDTDDVIITYNIDNSVFDFEGYSEGQCYLYRVSYDDEIIGLDVGNNVSGLEGCYVVSNPMTVNKQTGNDCPGDPCDLAQTCVSGSLWIDHNDNGVRDTGDEALVDIPVCLYSVENNMLISHSCVEASSTGTYSLCNLPMGNYVVGAPTSILVDGEQFKIIDPSDDSQIFPSTGFTSTFTLEAEQCQKTISVGYSAESEDVCNVDGGEIFISDNVVEVIVCVSDGVSDLISLTLEGTEGTSHAWTISNGSGTIIAISNSPQFEFEGEEEEGVCLIRHVSYEGDIVGLNVGESISRLEGCFDLSNVFIVNKLAGNNCTLYDGPDTDAAIEDGAKAFVSGKVATQFDREISHAEISISTDGMENINRTDESGEYAFSSLDMYKDYHVLPYKNDDLLNGVSVIDIVIIQRHILGLDVITSPYDLIAADINNSQSISATDLVTLRKVILGVMDDFPNNTSWRFIDSKFQFPDPKTPWSFADDMMLEDLSTNYSDVDFVGIKVGDLNSNVSLGSQANLTSAREADTKVLRYKDRDLSKGTEVSVPVYVTEDMRTLGLQFTLDLADGVNVLHVGAGKQEMRDIHFAHVGDNQVTISWSNYEAATVAQDQSIFSIKLWVEKDIKISDAIELTSAVTPALMYSEQYDEYKLSLEPGDKEVNQFELYQNKPNPFDNTTEINFRISRPDKAFLRVKNVYGQTLYSKEVSCQEGRNSIIVSASDLQGASGLLYYSLTVGKDQKTGSMVFVK